MAFPMPQGFVGEEVFFGEAPRQADLPRAIPDAEIGNYRFGAFVGGGGRAEVKDVSIQVCVDGLHYMVYKKIETKEEVEHAKRVREEEDNRGRQGLVEDDDGRAKRSRDWCCDEANRDDVDMEHKLDACIHCTVEGCKIHISGIDPRGVARVAAAVNTISPCIVWRADFNEIIPYGPDLCAVDLNEGEVAYQNVFDASKPISQHRSFL